MHLLFGLAIAALALFQPVTVHVTVRVVGIRAARGGELHVALHREPGTGFPGPSAFQNRTVRPTGDESMIVFDAPPGSYAVAVHHDANANGRMDSNFFGMPKEGYAVSRDVRPKLRAPRFREAEVRVDRDTTIVVRMAY